MDLNSLDTIAASPRFAATKGHARRVRAAGAIPAIIYGRETEAAPVSVDPKEVRLALMKEYRFNAVLDVAVDGGNTYRCMVKDHQIDPVRREITHLDFYVVDPEQEVVINVPVSTVNKSAGERAGGRLDIVSRAVKLRCKVKDIPATVAHDVEDVEIGESVYVDEMTPPDGCTFEIKHRYPVIRVAKKRGPLPVPGEEGEGAELAEGAVEGEAAAEEGGEE